MPLGRVLAGVALLLALGAAWLVMTPPGQDFMLPRLLEQAIGPVEPRADDRLDVLICGSASPVRQPGRGSAPGIAGTRPEGCRACGRRSQ